jgi:hypothetical protein
MALFLLGFFSIHFCGFHAGHAAFLSMFFPIDSLRNENFFDAFMNPFLLWKIVFQHVLPVYGIFLIPAIIAERKHVFSALIASVQRARNTLQMPVDAATISQLVKKNAAFSQSYKNVMRMHFLIFFFAMCQFAKIESFAVFAVVYFVYFFPWGAFKQAEVEE